MTEDQNWLEFFQDRERLHADYYLDLAQQHARRDKEAYECLEAEIGNLLRVADWLAAQDEGEGVLRLAESLWQESDFMRSRGFMRRGLPLLEQARQAAKYIDDLETEFVWLEALANIHHEIGVPELALPLFEDALALVSKFNNIQLEAKVHLGMGRVLMEQGQLDQAASWLERALQDYRQCQDYEGEIVVLTALGNLFSLLGNFPTARNYLELGLFLAKNQRNCYHEVSIRYALGYAAALACNWKDAIDYFENTTNMAQAIGDRFFEIRALAALGEAWLERGHIQKSVMILEEALIRQRMSDDILTKAATHLYLAKAYNLLNKLDDSLAQLKEVYPFRQVPLSTTLVAEAQSILVDNYLKQYKFKLALVALRDLLNLLPSHMTSLRKRSEILLKLLESQESNGGVYDKQTFTLLYQKLNLSL